MRIAVVGGGAVGLCCAWSLARRGAEVVVYERDRVGSGCSLGNTGWICPGLSAPLPAPGVMGAALRGMLSADSPVRIRPLVGPDFLRWSWQFWRACSPERYRAGLEATVALSRRTFELFDELRSEGVEFEMHSSGMVVAALTEPGLAEYRTMLREAQEAGYGGEVRVLDGDAVRALEPAASDAVVGGVHAPAERYVRPEGFTRGLTEALRRGGAEVREGVEVHDLEQLDGDAVVVAAGVWSRRLLESGGVRLPMEAAKGYSVTARGSGTVPRHAYYLAEAKVGCSTFGDVVRIAGVFDLTGLDVTLRRRRIETITRSAAAYFRDWEPEDVELEWAGLRPYPSDGLPIIDRVPGRDRIYVATGHGRLGLTLAPATGELLADVILAGAHPAELAPFSFGRLGRPS
ncbi:MAG: NAD(P)/FAD-dependent oxidoreductase [Gaiellaceae bacterium]